MNLQTTRLIIRPSIIEDASEIHSFLSDSDTMKFFVEGTYSLEKIQEFLYKNKEQTDHYSLVLKDTNQVIGKISFHKWFMHRTYEIGWIMNPKYTNQGYMSEAVEAVLEYGFDSLNIHRIVAQCQPENNPSKRLCDRFMRFEGHNKKCIHVKDDIWWDELFYAVLKGEYPLHKEKL